MNKPTYCCDELFMRAFSCVVSYIKGSFLTIRGVNLNVIHIYQRTKHTDIHPQMHVNDKIAWWLFILISKTLLRKFDMLEKAFRFELNWYLIKIIFVIYCIVNCHCLYFYKICQFEGVPCLQNIWCHTRPEGPISKCTQSRELWSS